MFVVVLSVRLLIDHGELAKDGSTPKTGASPLDGQIFRLVSGQFPSHFSSTKRALAGGNFRSYESHTRGAGSTSFSDENLQ